jgi:hypothetical protein
VSKVPSHRQEHSMVIEPGTDEWTGSTDERSIVRW